MGVLQYTAAMQWAVGIGPPSVHLKPAAVVRSVQADTNSMIRKHPRWGQGAVGSGPPSVDRRTAGRWCAHATHGKASFMCRKPIIGGTILWFAIFTGIMQHIHAVAYLLNTLPALIPDEPLLASPEQPILWSNCEADGFTNTCRTSFCNPSAV